MAQESAQPSAGSPQAKKPGTPARKAIFGIPSDMSPFSVWLVVLTFSAALFGYLLLAAYAWQERAIKVFAVGALVALAATAIASVGGFLFGLPRYSSVLTIPVSDSASRTESSITAAAEAQSAAGVYTPSNNLEQVSDWLTKLLLGAGLVQLGRVGRWLGGFINGLTGALTSSNTSAVPSAAKVVAGSLLGFYSAFGFLFGYIVTTIWYRRRLEATMRHIAARARDKGGSPQ
jgi:hypothetical protein